MRIYSCGPEQISSCKFQFKSKKREKSRKEQVSHEQTMQMCDRRQEAKKTICKAVYDVKMNFNPFSSFLFIKLIFIRHSFRLSQRANSSSSDFFINHATSELYLNRFQLLLWWFRVPSSYPFKTPTAKDKHKTWLTARCADSTHFANLNSPRELFGRESIVSSFWTFDRVAIVSFVFRPLCA